MVFDVFEKLMEELDFEIKEKEQSIKSEKKKQNIKMGKPDYTWLMDQKKPYRVSRNMRLELKELSKTVTIDEGTKIINEFRELIKSEINVEHYPTILKFILRQRVLTNLKQEMSYKQYQSLNANTKTSRRNSDFVLQDRTIVNIKNRERPRSAPSNGNFIKRNSKVAPLVSRYQNNKDYIIDIDPETVDNSHSIATVTSSV